MISSWKKRWLCCVILMSSLWLSGCQLVLLDSEMTFPHSNAQSNATAGDATPSVQLELQSVTAGESPTAVEIFDEISPAVAFVETASGTGSGVFIEHGYLLSNAHVVWPYDQVRVVFPDGTEHVDVPVHSWDLVADLALIGPIESDVAPVHLVDGTGLDIGTDIYLIGYPAELEDFPTPSITNGILSRLRTWEAIDYDFFQVDATTVGGQSGGILVTQQGDVIGISTFYFNGFGLASSVADALPRLNDMLAGNADFALETRPFGGGEGSLTYVEVLDGLSASKMYILDAALDEEVEITANGIGKPGIYVQTISGAEVDFAPPEAEGDPVEVSFTVESEQPHVVLIFQPSENENEFELTSSHPLVPYLDLDDNQAVSVGAKVIGSIDTTNDEDTYEVELNAGDVIKLTVDSIAVDPAILVEFRSDNLYQIAYDDDSAGGVFGHNAELIYEAPEDETYEFIVSGAGYGETGGYILTIEEGGRSDELTELEVDEALLSTGYGPMLWYESETYDYAFLRPLDWQESRNKCGAPQAVVCYVSEIGNLLILEEDLRVLPKRDRTREGYIEVLTDVFEGTPSLEIIGSEETTTLQKYPADRFSLEVPANRVLSERLVFVDEEELVAINIGFFTQEHLFAHTSTMADFIFDSFRYWDTDEREEVAVYHLDEASRLADLEQYEDAKDALNKAIEIDPELEPAYRRRASIHLLDQDFENALADMDQAVDLMPERTNTLSGRAMVYYHFNEPDNAIVDIDAAIALDPKDPSFHNLRSLINAFRGEYEMALADIDMFQELSNGELLPNAQDSRGFIYIRMGEFEKAKEDFDAIYEQDLRFPYALLGGGIAYFNLGLVDEGVELLEEAMDEFEEDDLDDPEPQLRELLKMANEILGAEK